VRVRLLGGFGVEVGGESVDPARWRLRKARTVVKLLCLDRGQRLHREFLLHLLWPNLSPGAASNNLHQALHVARRALAAEGTDGLLELRDHLVVLRADGLVDVDADRFRTMAVAALEGGDLAALREADAAYRGELLPEDRFEPWASGPRDELHALHRDVLVGLGQRLRVEGLLIEAETALERALERDPLHESALRLLLRVLADSGRRSAALMRFERARTDMRSAYGSDPDPETRRLYRELLVGSADTEGREHLGEQDQIGRIIGQFVDQLSGKFLGLVQFFVVQVDLHEERTDIPVPGSRANVSSIASRAWSG
jgi:DNA-binding SARP family transcriptional activator